MTTSVELPNILISGASGTGKSTCLRNLDTATTVILNTERKRLPFRRAKEFNNIDIKSVSEFSTALREAVDNPDVKTIVIDSFTSLSEMVHEYCAAKYEGYELWAKYKEYLFRFLQGTKVQDKFVVWIGIEDTIQDEHMRVEKITSVQGSLKGKIEKEFEIVLWTKVLSGAADKKPNYVFVTNGDPSNRAKSPMEMFDDQHIPNDLSTVLTEVHEYYA